MEEHRELEYALLKNASVAEREEFAAMLQQQAADELRTIRARDDNIQSDDRLV
jgi:hypothetical protein